MSSWLNSARDSMLGRPPQSSVGYSRVDMRGQRELESPSTQVGAPHPNAPRPANSPAPAHFSPPPMGPVLPPVPGPPAAPNAPVHHHHSHLWWGADWGYPYPVYYALETCPSQEEINAIIRGIQASALTAAMANDTEHVIANLISRNCLWQAQQLRDALTTKMYSVSPAPARADQPQPKGPPIMMSARDAYLSGRSTQVAGCPRSCVGTSPPSNPYPPNLQDHPGVYPHNPQPSPYPRSYVGAIEPLQTMSPFGTLRLGPGSVYPTANRTLSAAEQYKAKAFVFGDRYYPAAISYQEVMVPAPREIVPR